VSQHLQKFTIIQSQILFVISGSVTSKWFPTRKISSLPLGDYFTAVIMSNYPVFKIPQGQFAVDDSFFPVAPTLEQRASVKHFVSLQFFNSKTVGRTPWMGDQPVARLLPIQTQNKHRQTSMSYVGFEPTIPAFERAKTVDASDCAATVTGRGWLLSNN
jgi:hypothetical protein